MIERSWMRFLGSLSDNLKSKIQNRKWVGIFAVVLTFALCGARVEAQQPKKVPRIGLLISASIAVTAPYIEAFQQGLRELGYIEGKNIVLARISHNGIISRTASPDNTFPSLIRGDQHHCHGNRTGNWTPIAAIRLCTSRSPSSQA
jgi:hypothetical protein